jgi:hypothetical protein
MATDFTIADVLAWARTKPADEGYSYSNGWWTPEDSGCALCQFLKDTSRADRPAIWPVQHENGDGEWAEQGGGRRIRYPGEIEKGLMAGTFGGLVAELEKLCPAAPLTKSDWLAIETYLAADCVSHSVLAGETE